MANENLVISTRESSVFKAGKLVEGVSQISLPDIQVSEIPRRNLNATVQQSVLDIPTPGLFRFNLEYNPSDSVHASIVSETGKLSESEYQVVLYGAVTDGFATKTGVSLGTISVATVSTAGLLTVASFDSGHDQPKVGDILTPASGQKLKIISKVHDADNNKKYNIALGPGESGTTITAVGTATSYTVKRPAVSQVFRGRIISSQIVPGPLVVRAVSVRVEQRPEERIGTPDLT